MMNRAGATGSVSKAEGPERDGLRLLRHPPWSIDQQGLARVGSSVRVTAVSSILICSANWKSYYPVYCTWHGIMETCVSAERARTCYQNLTSIRMAITSEETVSVVMRTRGGREGLDNASTVKNRSDIELSDAEIVILNQE